MSAQEQMEIVNEIARDISEKLGMLTKYGVLSVEDSMKIIIDLNDKHYKWMERKFTPSEIYNFVYGL